MQALLRKIRQILKDRRTRRFFTRVVSSVAAIVIFVTTYALILPAITLEKTAACGIEEHQHSDSCYEKRLVCGQEESDGHHHDDSCYSSATELTCKIPEHLHSAEKGCYDADGNLICELQEHVHDDSCYEEVRTLTCGQEEYKGHHHTDACYEKVLVCGKEVHTHSEKCYEEGGSTGSAADTNSSGKPSESVSSEDADNTGDISGTGDAGDTGDNGDIMPGASDPNAAEEALPENDNYVPELEPLDMEVMLNSHTDLYYFHAEEGEKTPANSAEITDWRKVEEETTLTSTDLVKAYLAYTIPAGSLNETNPTARYRLPGNIHLTDGQIKAINKNENGITAGFKESDPEYQKYLGAEAIEGDRTPDELLSDSAQEYISAVVRAENVYKNDKYIGQDLIFTFVPYTIEKNQETFDAEKNPVSAGEKITGWFACDFRLDQIDWIEEELQEETQEEIQDETQGEFLEQAQDNMQEETPEETDQSAGDPAVVTVEKTAEILFVTENKDQEIEEIKRTLKLIGQKEDAVSEEEVSKEETKEETQEFQSGTLTADGEGYKITLDYTEEAKIPENASLSVREITAETDKEAYEACLEQAGQQVAADNNTSVDQKASRFFDIEIVVTETDGDGTEKTVKIEPSAPVSVNIQIEDKQPSSQESKSDQSEPTILHFAEEGVEQIDSTVTDSQNNNTEEQRKEIQFEAESFSVYGVVYTVDFHWEVDGKTYEFSIPGGGFVSFYDLVKTLGIESDDENTEKDEIQELVDGVESIEFSNPELISVSKVEEDTSVGAIKDGLGLECEYSAELTKEQIEEINAQEAKAGDWALISMTPFNTEESLTVTMKNGDVWTVKVTDAQVGTIENGGKYIIYFPYEENYYYVLKGDGSTERLYVGNNGANANQVLNGLGDEYLWSFENPYYNYWRVHNSSSGLYLQLDETRRSQGSVTSYNVTGVRFVQSGWDGFPFFHVSEYSSNNNWGYDWYYLGFENGKAVTQNRWENTEDAVFLFKQEERTYNFTVKIEYDNIHRGTVTGRDKDNIQRNNMASFVGVTNNGSQNFTNKNQISAKAEAGYLFDHWQLGDKALTNEDFLQAPQLSSDGKTSTIPAGALAFPEDNMILTAVFKKDATSTGVADYSGLIHEYMESLKKDPLIVDKTAEVYDYDNRIYEVDITASGDAQIITPDVELAFVTDISRSMYFPSDLKSVGTFTRDKNSNNSLIRKLESLHQSYTAEHQSSDGKEVYYVVTNHTTDATVYAFRKNGNDWYAIDASYDVRDHGKSGVTVYNDWDYRSSTNLNVNRWFKVDDRYQWDSGDQRWELDTKALTDTNIYVANDHIYRLDYLQQAVDIASDTLYSQNQGAKIGLVTFAKTAASSSLYGKDEYSSLIYDLNDISPTGNTNQRAGLEEAASAYWKNQYDQPTTDPNHKRVVILVTDGAPNPGSDYTSGYSDWSTINANNGIATKLKRDYNATLYTIGISVDNVEGAKTGLTNAASSVPAGTTGIGTDGKYAFFTSDGPGLVESILQIVQSLFTQVDLYGTVTDTVDAAFYPVNADGTPVQQGFYKEDGTPLDASLTEQYDEAKTPYYSWTRNGENWIINWFNVKFERAQEKDSDGNIVVPGVRKSILIKSKEDFLGGNTISTNADKAYAIANYYKEIVKPGETTNIKGALTPPVNRSMDTPYVNVDELKMNDHETTWTVYLGTTVDPQTQLREMFNDIMIREVVTKSKSEAHQQGFIYADSQVMEYDPQYPNDTARSGTTIYNVERGAYEDNDETLKDVIPAEFELAKVIRTIQGENLTNTQWNNLLSGKEISFKYYGDPAYGHGTADDPVGVIKLKLTSTIAAGEQGFPDAHETSVTNEDNNGNPVERYNLTVTYTPTGPKGVEYYTGTYVNTEKQPGKVTDQIVSENKHTINVFEKKLQILKKDKTTGALITDKPARFTLYKSTNSTAPQEASDIVSETGSVVSGYDQVTVLTTNTLGDNAGKTDAYSVAPLHFGMFTNDPDKTTTYYLVETEQPEGYRKSTAVWPVTLSISETPTNEAGTAAVASALPYNWTQTAILTVGDQTSANNSETVTVTLPIENEKGVDIEILKVDEKGEPLNLATFRLQKKEGSYQDIKSIKVSSTSEELKYPNVGGLDENSSFVSGTEKVTITKLPDGDYKLVEDNTHTGYIIRQKEILFTITNGVLIGTDIDGIVTFDDSEGSNLALITVINEPGAALPNTGGPGTRLFTIVGSIIILGAGVLLWRRRRLV